MNLDAVLITPYTQRHGRTSNDVAGFAPAKDRIADPPRRLLTPDSDPTRFQTEARQPAASPPGSYPDRTSTGRR
jgi:hypothetical protein